jgi:hypothetical protein
MTDTNNTENTEEIKVEVATVNIETILASIKELQVQLDFLKNAKEEVKAATVIVNKPPIATIAKTDSAEVKHNSKDLDVNSIMQVQQQQQQQQLELEKKQDALTKQIADKELAEVNRAKVSKYSELIASKKLSEDLVISTDAKVLDEMAKDLKIFKNIRQTSSPAVATKTESLTAEQKAFASLFDKGKPSS